MGIFTLYLYVVERVLTLVKVFILAFLVERITELIPGLKTKAMSNPTNDYVKGQALIEEDEFIYGYSYVHSNEDEDVDLDTILQ